MRRGGQTFRDIEVAPRFAESRIPVFSRSRPSLDTAASRT